MMPIAPQSRPDTRSLRQRRQTAAGIARAGAHLRQLFAEYIGNISWDPANPISLSLHAVNQGDLLSDGTSGVTVGNLLTAPPARIKKLTKRSKQELNQFLAKLGLGALGSWRARK